MRYVNFVCVFLSLIYGGYANAQTTEGNSDMPMMRRVVIVPPSPPNEKRVEKWLSEDNKTDRSKTARARFSDMMKEPPPLEMPATGTQLQLYAERVFAAELAQRLQRRAKSVLVPQTQAPTAPYALYSREQARQLCRDLQADALIQLSAPRIELREGTMREVIVRITVHLPYARPFRPKSQPEADPMFTFTSLTATGTDATGRSLFRGTYNDPLRNQVKAATKQAAARAVHQLLTQEKDPLTEVGNRWIVLPVLSPIVADKLRFTAEGRKFQPNSVTGLPGDVSQIFKPNLLPLSTENLVGAREIEAFLSRRNETIAEAWQSGSVPNTVKVQEWAKALRGDYVLMARVTCLEMEESTLETGGTDREARTETFGILLRVADGEILWQDRASATLRVLPRIGQRITATDAEILHDTTMFALLELQRRFARYRAGFTK